MTVGENTLRFTYDASGLARTVTWNGTVYYYATNLQGDIIAILDADGNAVVEYIYDAWGNIHATTGTLAATLGYYNPLRYRGYVYDNETELYYLQSRYYNPEIGRWINADSVVSGVGGEITGNNLFAYCFNNPVNLSDPSGGWPRCIDEMLQWVNEQIVQPVIKAGGELLYSIYYNATKWHFEDRIAANGPHPTYDEVISDRNWRLLPRDESIYHIDNVGKDEQKYVHPDGREAVFNGDTLEPMKDPQYMATYNYVPLKKLPDNPKLGDYFDVACSYVGHFVADVLFYELLLRSNTREQFESKVISIFE